MFISNEMSSECCNNLVKKKLNNINIIAVAIQVSLTKEVIFFYEMLVSRKFIKSWYKTVLRRELNIEQTQWKHIYQCKIYEMPDKSVAEFNYKLLNKILCNKEFFE